MPQTSPMNWILIFLGFCTTMMLFESKLFHLKFPLAHFALLKVVLFKKNWF